MNDFLYTTFGYPTIVFTILLVVAFIYWTMVIIGAVGIDVLDIDAEGAAEGATEGATEGVGETQGDLVGVFGGVLTRLKLRNVPFTLILSAVVLTSWVIAQLLSALVLVHWAEPLRSIGATAVLLIVPVVSLPLTSVVLRPLGALLTPEEQTKRSDWIGKIIVIDTSYVDGKFGTARADDGGAGLLFQVRCDGENRLKRGDRVLVVAFDTKADAYDVTPVDDFIASELGPTR